MHFCNQRDGIVRQTLQNGPEARLQGTAQLNEVEEVQWKSLMAL